MEQGALLTKENLMKRNCDELESLNHLFFTCPTAKVVWGIVALSLGAINIPTSLNQFWIWSQTWLPAKSHFYAFLLVAICWATWKTRNDACFNAKMIHHPAEIVCHACAFLNYWAGLHKEEIQSQIKDGVGLLLSLACQMLSTERRSTTRTILPPPATDEDRRDAVPDEEDA